MRRCGLCRRSSREFLKRFAIVVTPDQHPHQVPSICRDADNASCPSWPRQRQGIVYGSLPLGETILMAGPWAPMIYKPCRSDAEGLAKRLGPTDTRRTSVTGTPL